MIESKIESKRCQRCGGRVPKSNVLDGGCPRCMLELGFVSEVAKDAEAGALPASIGRYRILRVIGEGGMGIVYEAEQDQPRRTVALKIIKRGIANAELLWRFELETEALGRLQHPGIAQIYEAGTVDTGFGPQPYFAMELIRGLEPREFAELHHLDTRQRTELMIRICDAVHHAHQRGLIHRDLKPANILVDDAGQPKILDFGVVRVTDSDTRSTTDTRIGQLIGTLPYMSPEQALADPLELDTRTDVYSLGIIFYEMLTGRLPYTVSKKIHEAIQSIRDDDPARISALNRSYRGDIETIVGTALEKDKTRRYQSAFGLAIDLRRYLNDEPIAARPPSKSYQLRKFTRRHKTLVAGIASVFFAFVAGVVAVAWMVNSSQKDAASKNAALDFIGRSIFGLAVPDAQNLDQTEVTNRNGVLEFLRSRIAGLLIPDSQRNFIIRPIRRSRFSNPNMTLKEVLDSAVPKIHDLDGQPLSEAIVQEYFADTYFGLERYQESAELLVRALALRLREQGRTNPDTLQTTAKLAEAYMALNNFSEAEKLANQVIEDARSTAGDVDPYVQSAVAQLVSIYSRTLAIEDKSEGFHKIEDLLKNKIIDYQVPKSGIANPTVQFAIGKLLSLYTDVEPPKYSEAAKFIEQIARDCKLALGERNALTLKHEKQLLGLYLVPQLQPRLAENEADYETLFDAKRSALGDEHIFTQIMLNYLVGVYLEQGKPHYARAESLLKPVVEETRRKLGSESPPTRNASIALANVYLKQGRYKEAETLLIPYATDSAVSDAIDHPLVLLKQIALPDQLDQPDQQYPISVHTYGGKPANFVDTMARMTILENPTIVDILDRLAQTYDKQGKTIDAQATKMKLKAILESVLNSTRNVGDWEFGRPLKSMGVMAIRYIEDDRRVDADAMLNAVLDGYKQVAGKSANAEEIATLLTSAALTYTGKGNYPKAEELLKSIVKIDADGTNRKSTLPNSLVRLKSWYMDLGRTQDARRLEDRMKEFFPTSDRPEQSSAAGMLVSRTGVYDSVGFIPK